MTNMLEALQKAIENKASDIFIVSGFPMAFKINDVIEPVDEERLMPDATEDLIRQIYQLEGSRRMEQLTQTGDDDFSFSIKAWAGSAATPINSGIPWRRYCG